MPHRAFIALSAAFLIAATSTSDRSTTADVPQSTVAGTAFTLPKSWTIATRTNVVVATPPEPDAHVAIVDVGQARDATEAAARAWVLYRAGQTHPIEGMAPGSTHNGWDERAHLDYRTAADEKLDLAADVFRAGSAWTAILTDASIATGEKRGAAISLIKQSLRPAGYVRETFAGRTARQLDAARVDQLRSFVASSARALGVPGVSFAVIDHGKVVYEGGVGIRELGKPGAVDAHTRFQVASNTKGMTTLLLARLVDAGKLRWDEPVQNVYPAFRLGSDETTRKVLVRHLICACTGLPRRDYEWIFGSTLTTPASSIFDQLAATEPTSAFGEVFQYNNSMAAAAGYVAGHILYPGIELGAAYDRAMQREIFDPLRMTETTFDVARGRSGNYAGPHHVDDDFTTVPRDPGMDHGIVAYRPAAGAWSSAHDMIKYVQLELTDGVLPDGKRMVSADALRQRRAKSVPVGEDAFYGMGLMVDRRSGVEVIHHGGTMFGYASEIMAVPSAQVGAVILTNADEGQLMTRPFIRRVLELLYDGHAEAAGDVAVGAAQLRSGLTAERATITVPPERALAAQLARSYRNPDLGRISVTRNGPAVRFDFAAWGATVASRRDGSGAASFVTMGTGYEFVAGEQAGKRTLTLRDGQHEYVFVEDA